MATQSVFIDAVPRLEAVLESAPAARGTAVVCHPHPQFGGDMDTPVVRRVADALVAGGRTTVRFNFRGVGASDGAYGGGSGEVDDVTAAVAFVRGVEPGLPTLLVGYSFGAWVALRAAATGAPLDRVVLIAPPFDMVGWDALASLPASLPVAAVVGDRDQFCDAARLARAPGVGAVRVLAGLDHYFGVGMDALVAAVVSVAD